MSKPIIKYGLMHIKTGYLLTFYSVIFNEENAYNLEKPFAMNTDNPIWMVNSFANAEWVRQNREIDYYGADYNTPKHSFVPKDLKVVSINLATSDPKNTGKFPTFNEYADIVYIDSKERSSAKKMNAYLQKEKNKLDPKRCEFSFGQYQNYLDVIKSWKNKAKEPNLSEEFIEANQSKLNWVDISKCQTLSEAFVERHSKRVCWNSISIYQNLSEKFIEKHNNKVDWSFIVIYQKLSEGFIEKYKDKINLNLVARYQKVSKEFIEKYKINIPEDCWIYKTDKYKLDYMKKHDLPYQLSSDETYLIAYVSTKSNCFDIRELQYKIGETYEVAHYDCNAYEWSSFGLTASTSIQASKDYEDMKLFEVKIEIKDISCFLLLNGHRLRCRKIKIIKAI